MYMSPVQPIDVRNLRPLCYHAGDLVLWKSYFGRYHPDLRPTFESSEGNLSANMAYDCLKNSSKGAAKAIHKNYLEMLEIKNREPSLFSQEDLKIIEEMREKLMEVHLITE
jgi:hypothetical protein